MVLAVGGVVGIVSSLRVPRAAAETPAAAARSIDFGDPEWSLPSEILN